jgi:hypothetical protein
MERALARPEDAANLGTMGGVIPEAAYMNAINQTNQFSAEAEAMANRRRDADRAWGREAAKEDLLRAGGELAALKDKKFIFVRKAVAAGVYPEQIDD